MEEIESEFVKLMLLQKNEDDQPGGAPEPEIDLEPEIDPDNRNRTGSQEVGFSRKHHSSEGCATVWGGAKMREGPEWRRRATGSRPEVRGSTRGGPEMNQKTGNGPEIRGTTGGGPEVDQKEDRMKKKTSEGTEFTPESSRR
ncbi:hypothetical protein B0H10DRAFT_1963870 [Mycena sp. CBHHK59/15]|nr:hypothetical protein B0H10DRAFT_1963870 [Mycena sp. CBHHK59/15]